MPLKLPNVVVLAGSGNLGPAIIKELVNAGYSVTATTRSGSKSTFQNGVKVVETDYSLESLTSIFQGQDVVLSLVPQSLFTEQNKYVDAALKAGIKRFIPSEFGSDSRTEAFEKLLPKYAKKKLAIEYLKTKESEGLTWTSIITGAFFDWGLEIGLFQFHLKQKVAKIYDGGNVPFTTTNLSTIGKAIVGVLEHPEETANRYIAIETATITQNQILEALVVESGTKWTVENVDSLEEREKARKEIENGNPLGNIGLLQSFFLNSKEDNHSDLRKSDVGIWNEKLGLPTEDYKDTIKAVVSKY